MTVEPGRSDFVEAMAERARRFARSRLDRYRPYAKQQEFHAAGADKRERLLMAGNQLGKTYSGAAEAAYHLTGRYPDWWTGRRFEQPIRMWAGSKTGEVTRDGVQRLLVGEPKDPAQWGTGLIPGDCIADTARRMGVADALDSALIDHVSGSRSTLGFKSYDQGREKWQGETLDVVWFDEEPPLDIYTEGLTRTNARPASRVYMTFTPLLGMSDTVMRFLLESSPDRHVTNMTIEDAYHYTEEERRRIIDSYPEYEREARAKGIPTLGSGRVFPVADDVIACDSLQIPNHWFQIGGMDFGWDHPFAAVKLAIDRDTDTVYVTACYRKSKATPAEHVPAIRPWGKWLPWAWPHDGFQHDKGSGKALARQYEEQGLVLCREQATFYDGGNGVEAGVADMLDRMRTGRFKVFRHLNDWFEEFRLYHREDGKIVKLRDDLLSATRYALMMQRHAVQEPKVGKGWKVKTDWVV